MKSSYFRLAFAVACTGILVNAAAAQTVQFETSSLLVNGTSMTVNVIITSAPSTPVTVQIGTLDGTAFSPGDYTAASGTLVFPAGSISPQSFTVAGINTASGGKQFYLQMSNLTGPATLGTALMTVTIQSSLPGGGGPGGGGGGGGGGGSGGTPTPVTVQFASPTYTVNENGLSASIQVSLSAAPTATVKVNYATSNGAAPNGAIAGLNYTSTSGTLTFTPEPLPGGTPPSQTFTVPILDDGIAGPNRTVNLTLSAPDGATLGTQSTAVLTIIDADMPSPSNTHVVVKGTGGTFSPDPAPIDSWVNAKVSAKAKRPATPVSYALTGPVWDWEFARVQYSNNSIHGPWHTYTGAGFSYSIFSAPSKPFDGTYDHSAMTVSASFPSGTYWRVGSNAQVKYIDATGKVYKGVALVDAKGAALEVILEKTPDAFIPEGPDGKREGNTVNIKAYVKDKAAKGQFKFTLFDVSSLPGYAMNAPLYPPKTGKHSATWKDLQFHDQKGYDISGDNRDVAVTKATDLTSAEVEVQSYDYGGWGKIKVEFIAGKNKFEGVEKAGTKKHTNIPLDDDDNHIADKSAVHHNTGTDYKIAKGDEDDDWVPEEGNAKGDGLTLFEEYRGFIVKGKHVRPLPWMKDVFVSDQSGYYEKDGKQDQGKSLLEKFFMKGTKIAVHHLQAGEFWPLQKGFPSESYIINPNRDGIKGAKAQRAIVIEAGTLDEFRTTKGNPWGLTAFGGNRPSTYTYCKVVVPLFQGKSKLAAPLLKGQKWLAFEPENEDDGGLIAWATKGRLKVGNEVLDYEGRALLTPKSSFKPKLLFPIKKDVNAIPIDIEVPDGFSAIYAIATDKGYEIIKANLATDANSTQTILQDVDTDREKKEILVSGAVDATDANICICRIDDEYITYSGKKIVGDDVYITGVKRGVYGDIKEHKKNAKLVFPNQLRNVMRGYAGSGAFDLAKASISISPVNLITGLKRGKEIEDHKIGLEFPWFWNDDAIQQCAAHEATHACGVAGHIDNSIMIDGNQFRGNYLRSGGGLIIVEYTEAVKRVINVK